MSRDYRLVDAVRRRSGEAQSHLIDSLVAGRIGRRDFLRQGSVLGLSLPLLGGITTAFGLGGLPRRALGAPGGTLRVGHQVPTAAVEPVTVPDAGGLMLLGITGEFLCVDGPDLVLRPQLATGWSPNEDGTKWNFTLRQGVKFHDGREMKADDVVATFDRLADPANSSNALSVFRGVLAKGNTRKVDDYTVEFNLDAANGNFPYLVSSDNYNAIILPADFAGGWEKTFIGTGPFRLDKFVPKVSASFVRNEDYWGTKALLDRVECIFYTDIQPQILALQGGQIDVINQLPVLAGVGLLNDPNVNIVSLSATTHHQLHMRTDMDPFKDARVRRAVALCLDRPRIVQGLMKGRAQIGNDNPFAGVYPSTDPTVPQREKNVAEAKQLAEAAGLKPGTKVTLTTERYLEIPEFAVLLQNAVKEIGLEIELNILDQGAYYGDAVYGKSPWLDSVLGITDYGHRGVPNVFLAAPLMSDGTWNSAHFRNPTYDQLATDYIAALDLDSQRAIAGKIQRLLLDETPVIFGYFYDYLTATTKKVAGVQPTAMSQLFLGEASIAG